MIRKPVTTEAQYMSKDKSRRKQNGYQLATLIRTSAHDIWLAGLGAYARANKEGSRLFDSLVELGESVERKAREQVARPFRVAERQVEGAKSAASETWDRLEMLFDRRVARTLHSLQIPTQRDVAELTERVAKLQALVEKLSAAPTTGKQASRPGETKTSPRAKTKTQRSKRVSKKTAARKTPIRKPRAAATRRTRRSTARAGRT